MYSCDELFLHSLECYFGVYCPRCFACGLCCFWNLTVIRQFFNSLGSSLWHFFDTKYTKKYTTNLPQNGSIIWMENVFHKISVICETHYILVLHVEYDTPCKQFNNVSINMSMAHDYIIIVLYRNTFFCHFCTPRKLLPWISQLPLWWCLINLMPPGRPYSCADKVDGC